MFPNMNRYGGWVFFFFWWWWWCFNKIFHVLLPLYFFCFIYQVIQIFNHLANSHFPKVSTVFTGNFFFFLIRLHEVSVVDFPHGSASKESACKAGDPGLILGLGRSSEEWNGNPLHYSRLETPMDRGACWATIHGVAKSQTWLSDFTSFPS